MLLTDKYASKINGVLGCFDRVIIRGVCAPWIYAGGMTGFFCANGLRIFDFHKVFTPVTESIKANAKRLAKEAGLEIEYIRSPKSFRKDDRIDKILASRGKGEGLVWIFSQMEVCQTYKPWHDKQNGKTTFNHTETKCLHYYFYFIDKELGLCFLKLATIAPFVIEFYFNGHNLLALKLTREGTRYEMHENGFSWIEDFARAQELSDNFRASHLVRALDAARKRFCPLPFEQPFKWTIHQVEYSLDIAFKDREELLPIYENIVRTAMHTIVPEDIANFLGKRFSNVFKGEAGSKYNRRPLGTRVKHRMGANSLKVYDKANMLRIEFTSNDVSKLRTYRDVIKRDGSVESRVADLKKDVSSMYDVAKIAYGACRRYLEFISSFDDPTDGMKKLKKLTAPVESGGRSYKGFNFFDNDDRELLSAIAAGEFVVSGITNKVLRRKLTNKNSGQVSRLLKRLRVHGVIKKTGATYVYHLTKFGRDAIAGALRCIDMAITPALSAA